MNYKPCETTIVVHTDIHLPELELAKSLMVKDYKSSFDSDPHITHLLLPIFEEQYQKLQPILNQFLMKQLHFSVEVGEVEIEESGFFKLPVGSLSLEKFHNELLDLVTPYRDVAVRKKDITKMESGQFSEEEFENIIKYGYANVGKLFRPQITLGKCEIKNIDLQKLRTELNTVLANTINSNITLNDVAVILIGDGKANSDMDILNEEIIRLKKLEQ